MSKAIWARALLTVVLRGPGKALLLASATGWIAMAWLLTGDPLAHSTHSTALGHTGHATATTSLVSGYFMAMWLAMILAMGPPLLLREIGHLWRTSLRRLRYPAVASFLCGYAGIWLLTGIALSTVLVLVAGHPDRIVIAVALVVLWQCSPARQRCLNACHRVRTLRVFGTRAQWDAFRYGTSTGGYCVATCGLLMFLVLLIRDHHLAAMAVTTGVTIFERHLPARRPGWRFPILRSRSPNWPGLAVATPNDSGPRHLPAS
jgi:predicted metal-binding membrane protein